MPNLDLNLNKIADPLVKEGLQTVQEFMDKNPFVNFTGKLQWYTVSSGATFTVNHSVGFKPTDILLLSSTAGAVTINYSASTKTTLTFTTTTSGTVRFLVGVFK